MSHLFLNSRAERDIDRFVQRLLKDIDVSEPPLRLELVRDQLELDRAYFSQSVSGAVLETIHRMKVAGKQVIRRPALLWDAIKKWELKALYVPDRKRILIDSDLPTIKQRWNEYGVCRDKLV